MFNKLKKSLKNINYKLFLSLFMMGLSPTIYTTLRVFWLGNFPTDASYSIAGQLLWINLIYEIIDEAFILPLFYFIGKTITNKKELTNKVKSGLIIILGIYTFLSINIIIFCYPLLKLMATNLSIIDASATYIRIEVIANVFAILSQFSLIGIVTLAKHKNIYILIIIKLILCVILDIFLVSSLNVSANLGVNGIGITNIIVNSLIFAMTLFLLTKNGINVFNREKMSFKWIKEFIKKIVISGLESLVRNLAYIVMIVRMINVVNEQGTYWVANNFIWGWLLLPIMQLGELIKQETSTNKNSVKNNSLGYFAITIITILVWCGLIPIYKPFMQYVCNYHNVDKLFELVMVLFGFYILYALQNVVDATFYGLGKMHYMLWESLITNLLYYGLAFILYMVGIWQPTLISIALLFGIGNAFDTLVSFGAYWFLLKTNHINILDVENNKCFCKQ